MGAKELRGSSFCCAGSGKEAKHSLALLVVLQGTGLSCVSDGAALAVGGGRQQAGTLGRSGGGFERCKCETGHRAGLVL